MDCRGEEEEGGRGEGMVRNSAIPPSAQTPHTLTAVLLPPPPSVVFCLLCFQDL